MKTRELIHEARVNILRDVSTAVGSSPTENALWSDETLALYLRDGEAKFASRTLCLRDSHTPAVTQIELQAGVSLYPCHKSVKVIYAATYDGCRHLNRVAYSTRFGARGDRNPGLGSMEPGGAGAPAVYYTDTDTNHVGIYPTPGPQEDGKIIHIQVARLPVRPISLDRLDAESEIPGEYHLDLVDWACWRALRNRDVDLDSGGESVQLIMARASSHRNRFDAAVDECRREMKYQNVQLVQFGGNANWG